MKNNIFLFSIFYFLFSIAVSKAQTVYISESTEISFFSKAPIEDIDAVNKMSTSIITLHNDSIAFKVPITGFVFKDGLMQRHFNSNYMESDKKGFENATLKGKINEDIDFKTDGEFKVLVADHKIKIPGDKVMNIGKEIEVSVSANYKLYVKP